VTPQDEGQGPRQGCVDLGGGTLLSGGWPGALADGAGMAACGGQRNQGRERPPNRTRDGDEVEPGPSCRSPGDGDEAGASRHARLGALQGIVCGTSSKNEVRPPQLAARINPRRTRRGHRTSPHLGNTFRDAGKGTGRHAMLQEVGHGGC
jgi:hypothetical protein